MRVASARWVAGVSATALGMTVMLPSAAATNPEWNEGSSQPGVEVVASGLNGPRELQIADDDLRRQR